MLPLPAPGDQRLPRAVRDAETGECLHPGILRALLPAAGCSPLRLEYRGHGLTPSLPDGGQFFFAIGVRLRPGDLALCDAGGVADVRRVFALRAGKVLTGQDPLPGCGEWLAEERIFGRLSRPDGAVIRWPRFAWLRPLMTRRAALLWWFRRISLMAEFREDAAGSIAEKFSTQTAGYDAECRGEISLELMALCRANFPAGGRVLVAGCGAGNEVIALARAGFEVSGCDLLPEMLEAASQNARSAAVAAAFFAADLTAFPRRDDRWDGVLFTPHLYSFIPGSTRRIAALRALAGHLAPAGKILTHVRRVKSAAEWLQLWLSRRRRRARGLPLAEFGDWHTLHLRPDGLTGFAYIRRFTAAQVRAEARAAGLSARPESGGWFRLEASQPGG